MRSVSPHRLAIAVLLFAFFIIATATVTNASENPYAAIERQLKHMERHEGVFVAEIGKSLQNRSIYAVVFSRGHESREDFGEARRILIISGQHGNELMPVKAAMSLMDDLATGKDNWFHTVSDQTVLVFVPVVNPDGYAIGRRHNAANVDLNRNWQICDQPETAAVSKLVGKLRPDVLIDQHEWVTSDTQRPNCIEVAGFGTDPQFKLARILAAIGGQASPLLSSMAYSKTCNPGLAHRHFAQQGICSLLVETDPDQPTPARIQAYGGLVKATATALVSDDMRIRLEMAAIRSGQTDANPWLLDVCGGNTSHPPSSAGESPGRVGVCLVAMAGLLMWTFRLNSVRKKQPCLELAAVGPRTIRTFTVSELIQSDLAPSQKLAIIQRYRLRPSDRAREVGDEGTVELHV